MKNPLLLVVGSALVRFSVAAAEPSEVGFHGRKMPTVGRDFTLSEPVAGRAGRIAGAGTTIKFARSGVTEFHDLGGRMGWPGLMGSPLHPTEAAMTEFAHRIL